MTAPFSRAGVDAAGAPAGGFNVRRGLPSLALLLMGGLLLRLSIAYVIAPGQELSEDLRSFERWALTMADHGPGAFYENAGFADYPPGYLYFLWPIGIAGRFLGDLMGQPAGAITHGLLKLPAILADLAIAFLLYRSAGRWFGTRAGLRAAALFLFVPFTWYESALWGQMDSVGVLFLLAALLLLIEGWSEPAVALAAFAIVIKPQYAIGLVVLAPILLRRHMFRIGSGPVPHLTGRIARLDRSMGGWFTRRQGVERLVACALVAPIVFVTAIVPFDIWLDTQGPITGLPIVDHVRGYVGLTTSLAGFYNVLTANAFNLWALVGPTPLTSELSRGFLWTFASLPVIGSLPAVLVGAVLLGLAALVVAVVLFLRDDGMVVIVGFTVLAFAFFALPTRVHERYEYPVLVTGALLAAASVRWRWWYIAVACLGTVNLHAILTLARPGFATPGLINAPLGDVARQDATIIAVSVGLTLLFGLLLAYWILKVLLRTVTAGWQARGRPVVVRSVAYRGLRAVAGPAPGATARTSEASTPATDDVRAWLGSVKARLEPVARAVRPAARRFRARLFREPLRQDRSAELSRELGGRIDWRDLVVALVIVAGTFGTRIYRIDTPRTMYFDELYYPSTGAEFLQAWRYGIPTNIFEWTHPHVSKYIMAGSLAVLGNDRVTGAITVGAPVRDVAFEPAIADRAAVDGYQGDRIAVATGTEVRVAPHADFGKAIAVPVPRAAVVAFDVPADRLYVGTDDGTILSIDDSALDAASVGAAPAVAADPVVRLSGPIRNLWALAGDRLIAETAGEVLHVVDVATGSEVTSAALPGLRGVVPITVKDRSLLVASVPDGLNVLDSPTLESVGLVSLDAPPLGLDLVDGSQFGWANRATLPIPTLYVALEGNRLEAVQIDEVGALKPFDTITMPGLVTEVLWDRPTNMVHVLGKTSDGQPTIYVVEPHTNAVFADARLPFEPTAWTLDVQPDTPSLDRQRAIAFGAGGTAAVVDTGSHAFAWRLPGVLAGALTAGLMYLLARMLFRRRSVGLLLAIVMALDGLLFSQGRIAMNDSLLGFLIVAAFTLLGALMRYPGRGWTARLATIVGLPAVGLLLGLALGTKWVGAYAIGGAILLVLAQTRTGRRLALAGMVVLTGVLGYQALAGAPPNLTFILVMVGLTMVTGLVVARREADHAPDDPDDSAPPIPAWLDPGRARAGPFLWAIACLVVLPVVAYIASYVPWALSTTHDPQLFAGWPAGHAGQTFLDLQAQMYAYHNDLRIIHGQSSPWWAWPLGLRPIWGYYDTFSGGSQSLILLTANPVLLWMAIPAVAFGMWQAWRRRSAALGFVLIAFLALWIPWVRIDRVAYNYHWYTALPFVFLLLAYFLAELWHGPSRRTWALAKASLAIILIAPALMWIFRDSLCAVAGVNAIRPDSYECSRDLSEVVLPVAVWLGASLIVAWFVLGAIDMRRFVVAVVGVAAGTFIALLPALSAWRIPNGWPLIYQGLLPSWDITFAFNGNQEPPAGVPLLGPGPVLVGLLTAGAVWLAVRVMRDGVSLPRPLRAPGLPERATTQHRAGVAALDLRGRTSIDAIWVPVGLFLITTFAYLWINNGRPARFDYFVPLADAFLHRQLGLSAVYSWLHEVVYGVNGLYNVVFPPVPAILLMGPVAFAGTAFEQAWAAILLGAANVAIMSIVIAGMGTPRVGRIVLSLVFGFGTIVWFSAQVGTAWHFAQVVAIFFMLLAILACQRTGPTWLIGLLFAGAVFSRLPMLGAAPFFVAYLLDRTMRTGVADHAAFGALDGSRIAALPPQLDVRRFFKFAWPMAAAFGVPLLLYLAYNFLRFGSVFENGYALIPGLLLEEQYANGFFAIANIPRQFYAMVIAIPAQVSDFPLFQPPRIGTISILLTSPIFLWAFRARRPDWFNLGAWVSIFLILIPNFTHGDIGGEQFGYRYAQDIYPFLFLLTVRGVGRRIGRLPWIAIGVGFVVNVWGMAATYLDWFS